MSDKNIKAIRGQVRQICEELLDSELTKKILSEVSGIVNARLNQIDAYVKEQLKQLQEKAEETQSYVVRNLALTNAQSASSKVDDSASKPAS